MNDAKRYLDQVKAQFSGRPEVYKRFLDILKDFRDHVIDTAGVIERVLDFFHAQYGLLQGSNDFLPPGCWIECGTDERF